MHNIQKYILDYKDIAVRVSEITRRFVFETKISIVFKK